MILKLLMAGGIVGAVLAGAAPAQAQGQTANINVRGTIVSFSDNVLTVQTREGQTATVDVPESVNVAITQPFTMADLKPGMVLGVTTIRRDDGATVAIDIRPIPATANQGLSPHDLQPGSTMTNAELVGVVQSAASQEITVNYKTGSVTVLVPPGTPMSRAAPGSRSDLKPGETVYAATRRADNGRLTAIRVQVSKDGIKPTQ